MEEDFRRRGEIYGGIHIIGWQEAEPPGIKRSFSVAPKPTKFEEPFRADWNAPVNARVVFIVLQIEEKAAATMCDIAKGEPAVASVFVNRLACVWFIA